MNMILFYILLNVFQLFQCILSNKDDIHHHVDCKWTMKSNSPEAYFINMDRSVNRRITIEKHLNEIGLKHKRIKGINPREIYIPQEVEKTWQTAWCFINGDYQVPNRKDVKEDHILYKYNYIMAAMCGRGKGKNTIKELGCLTSHLVAMRDAIYSKTATSKYALIIEDDVIFPFDIDFEELANSAPKPFGILQLFNSNKESMRHTWELYKKKRVLWNPRSAATFDFWSTCAYLIDREVMKPIIDAVIYELYGWTQFKVIAGINSPCAPSECCVKTNKTLNFINAPPCVYAPRGFQADSYLYAMTTTYMISVPLIANGKGGNQSTFHQDHVEMLHKNAFRQQRQFINEMLQDKSLPPPFATPACKTLDVNEL